MANFLSKHSINERLRAKMMDWIIEVLKIYQQREETIFRAIFLLDYFLWKCPQSFPSKQLHLLGTVCLMIASKSEEVSYIHLKSVVKNIVYDKFTKEQLKETEMIVLQVINFRVNIPSIYDLCRCAFRLLNFKEKRIETFFHNSSLLVAKTCLFSLEVLNSFSYDEIAALSMIMVLKIIEKISP